MEKSSTLNTKGMILDKNQLENYLAKLASDNVLKSKSNKHTYPINRVKENFEYITDVYNMLMENIKLGITIHPAGEWLLDNYYIIEKTVKTIIKDMPLKKYINFVGLENENYNGFARIYVLANEIVAYTDGVIDRDNLSDLLRAYQTKKNLSMEEIWNIGVFMQICLIERIREICEKIYSSQIQKYKVESIIERLVENKKDSKFKSLIINREGKFKKSYIQSHVHGHRYGETKYPFIEYMSYRLKQYGKQAFSYLNIVEEQVEKMGTSVSDVIQKEHFDIALKKVSMGNCITSINTISRIDFLGIFEQINGVEEILKNDPINVYRKMDYKTKNYYRNEIEKMAKKTKISEIYIAKKCLELANNYYVEYKKCEGENIELKKKSHIGYFLVSNGKAELISNLLNKNIKSTNSNTKANVYILSVIFLSTIISALCGFYVYKSTANWIFGIIIFLSSFVIAKAIVTEIIQYALGKLVRPKMLPRLDMKSGVPKENATMVIIPTIIKNKEKVYELLKKLEVYYIANKSENMYFTLLGDCTSGTKETESFDEDVINAGVMEIDRLNKKYGCDGVENGCNRFNFVYRKRTWNSNEECYLGWERKRGLITQFNDYMLKKIKNPFLYNSITNIPDVKYIITLDSDTDLTLNSGLELIGTMAHVLNRPVVEHGKNVVVDGHGILQPRVGIGLLDVNKSIFTRIFSGLGGTDSYVNAIFDIYQDNFNEGIYTGKGIYDLKVFSKVLEGEIPENKVLSHDLLEGSYLRCGMVSDIMLMDGYPSNYLAFKSRLHRWIRGDYQILGWVKNKKLNALSKYKIIDNIFRSKLETSILISSILMILLKIVFNIRISPIIIFNFVGLTISYILEIINKIISKRDGETGKKTFVKNQTTIKNCLYKIFVTIANIPDKAYMSINAECKSLYRMLISKKHMLEWVTAEEAEKLCKQNLKTYYCKMLANVIAGATGLIASVFIDDNFSKIALAILSIVWLIEPFIMFYISRPIKEKEKLQLLNKVEQEYFNEIASRTWSFFKSTITEKNNYLPSDNYQEDRVPKLVKRTSSTNIGLAILSVIASYDMKFENLENTINLLEKILGTVACLQKWNGHLYNWYNTENLEPLVPRFVSTVDSGNFVGYLYVLLQFLEEQMKENDSTEISEKISTMIEQVNSLIKNTDFSKLLDYRTNLFSIGFDVEENKLVDSYYDLLASEARQASLVAIAKKDVDEKNWFNLGRTLTVLNKYKGLISWSGTAFEYLMPNINIPQYPGSLLDESCKFMVMSQKEYAKKLGIPWGISEAAFNLKDLNNNYQYKAFGIPWLGLKRGLADEMVVSAYASILAVTQEPKSVYDNLKILEKQGMLGKYGFYEAIDYTPNRVTKNKKYVNVKTYMAHHQGLILLSIDNLFNNNIIQKRFMKNPEMQAVNILLEERMPANMIVAKEKKEKVEKIKYEGRNYYYENVFNKINTDFDSYSLIANKDYSIIISDKGTGYSKYKNILVNRFKPTSDYCEGIFFYIKNIKNKKVWTNCSNVLNDSPDKFVSVLSQDRAKFTRIDGNIETSTNITVGSNDSVEIRRIELKNLGNTDETLEVSSFLEPVLSTKEQDYAHPAFNNLFLNYEYLEDLDVILVNRKNRNRNQKEMYMAVCFHSESEDIVNNEFEINKEKFYGRNNFGIPKLIENSMPYSNKIELVTNSIISFRKTIKIKSKESVKLDFLVCVSDDREYVINTIKKYQNSEGNKKEFELARARVETENRYLDITSDEVELYQKILTHIISNGIDYNKNVDDSKSYNINELWKFGISGDLPIICTKIKSVNDIDVIKTLVKAHEYFRTKNLEFDLVILNEEKEKYDAYVRDAIQDVILNSNVQYMLNQNGGIYILNNLSSDDMKQIEVYSKIILNAKNGNLKYQLDDLEDDIPKFKYVANSEIGDLLETQQDTQNENLFNIEEFKYYNEYGGFINDGKEYNIRINKNNVTPMPWSHIMANEKIGTLVTESGGGYTWYKNSRLNRISAWSNNSVIDIPSEAIYLKDEEAKKTWSLKFNPKCDNNDYYIKYGFGYAQYSHNSCKIKQESDVFVPLNDGVKVEIIRLKNEMPVRRKIKLFYYLKPVAGEDEVKTGDFLSIKFNKNNNFITAKNITNTDFKSIIFVSCSEDIKSYTGNKREFLGAGGLNNPQGLSRESIGNSFKSKLGNIIAFEIEVELDSLESKEISFALGEAESILECQDLSYKYSNLNNCYNELNSVKKYWNELLGRVQVKTPVESMNFLLNGWVMYQTMQSRIIGRTGFYQSGGAYGFRDQLQDVICAKYISPEITKNQIVKHSRHQFDEGDVEHWWHDDTKRGIRTRFSDDLLWLPYLVLDYIEYTNDVSILDEETNYLEGAELNAEEDERYDLYVESEIKGTIYEHCIKAIEKSLNFGENNLPKIGSGDWNDGFSTVGNKGKGESVWLAFFLGIILSKFSRICEYKNDIERANRYKLIYEKLKKDVNTIAWDGRWFKRAFMDDGRALGSIQNDECKIDSISQSWSVISNMADNDKKYISMESLENHLIDREHGLIKLLDPAFNNGSFEPGYIKAYLPGTRENGGQYTHV